MNLIATGMWDIIGNLGTGGAFAVVILCVVFYFQNKKTSAPAEGSREKQAEERGEIRVRLNNLEEMKHIVDKNQELIMELFRDNQRLTKIFVQEIEDLKSRVEKLEIK